MIVSDFGLNDAIESGLVKTPRVVIRDDGRLTAKYKIRLYHIYADPESRLTSTAEPRNRCHCRIWYSRVYYLLGKDWLEASLKWNAAGAATPPVMVTVANRTETAARIKYTFDQREDPHRGALRAREDVAYRLQSSGQGGITRGSAGDGRGR